MGWLFPDGEMDGHLIAFRELFGLADAGFDGDEIVVIFGEERGLPGGAADADVNGDDSPAIGDEGGDGLDVLARLRRDGDEVEGRGAFPVDDGVGEVDVHGGEYNKCSGN